MDNILNKDIFCVGFLFLIPSVAISLFNLSPVTLHKISSRILFDGLCFLLLFIIVVTNVDFNITWQT